VSKIMIALIAAVTLSGCAARSDAEQIPDSNGEPFLPVYMKMLNDPGSPPSGCSPTIIAPCDTGDGK